MRVLAINDISCVGKCSLSVTLPILSACGVTCDVLPTAILSTHTGGFEGYTFHDLTGEIPAILKHWQSLNLKFDFIYSGYLGNIEQIEMVRQIKRSFLSQNGVFVVDPVMGDSGKLYAGFTPDYVAKMRELCHEADYILPNVTEACYLADIPYPLNKNTVQIALNKLRTICHRPIVTGLTENNTVSVCFVNENDEVQTYEHENVAGFFCGAGDIFASAFVGCLAKGKNEQTAVQLASDFTTAAICRSATEVADKRYGLNFETEIFSFLKNINK